MAMWCVNSFPTVVFCNVRKMKKLLEDMYQLIQYSNGIQAEKPRFECWQGQDFSSLHNFQTGSGTYPVGTGGKADHSPHI
jgi:hypothetical protein